MPQSCRGRKEEGKNWKYLVIYEGFNYEGTVSAIFVSNRRNNATWISMVLDFNFDRSFSVMYTGGLDTSHIFNFFEL